MFAVLEPLLSEMTPWLLLQNNQLSCRFQNSKCRVQSCRTISSYTCTIFSGDAFGSSIASMIQRTITMGYHGKFISSWERVRSRLLTLQSYEGNRDRLFCFSYPSAERTLADLLFVSGLRLDMRVSSSSFFPLAFIYHFVGNKLKYLTFATA